VGLEMTDWTSGLYVIIRHPVQDGWTFRNERNPKWTEAHVARPSMYAVALYLVDYMNVPWQNIVWPARSHREELDDQD
jgi:hypothetical protein